ncbi:hypothetical protein [Komagataeibacter medellinensis]|uniref:hypothetical protein n=1 Tax=Komagataeibacter medellinensis TaxID=1177712 RepID=UPI0003AA195E|nr:hypothetical protein [Komagataeibacter medellinensis]
MALRPYRALPVLLRRIVATQAADRSTPIFESSRAPDGLFVRIGWPSRLLYG